MGAINNALQSVMSVSSTISARDFSTSGSISNYCTACNCYWTGSHVCFYPWYPVYWAPPQVDKMQTAFKLVKHLMGKNLVKLDKIEDFIAVIDEIVTIL